MQCGNRDLGNVKIPEGVFLIREGKSLTGAELTAHVLDRIEPDKKRRLESAMADAGVVPPRVVVHRSRALRSAGSLAALNRRFAGGPIAYDPTGMFRRTEDVVRCAAMVRETLGKKAGSILMDTARRTLYVVLDERAFKGNGLPFRAQTAEAMTLIAKTVRAWKKHVSADFEIAVRVGFEPPSGVSVVPVDDRSRPRRQIVGHIAARLRKAAGAAAVGAFAAGASTAACAADADPTAAVATTNFTVFGQGTFTSSHLFGGNKDGGDGGAEIVLPVGHSFGLQAEAGAGGDNYAGGAVHLFWRDPDCGMFGGFASDESLHHENMLRFGGEAEYYLDRITLSARGGDQAGDVEHGGFGRVDLGFYATPSFVVRGGFETTPLVNFGRASAEFQPAVHEWSGLSFFVDGDFGRGTEVMVGIKLHFGEQGETLIYRDRHEDPSLAIFNEMPLLAGHKTHYVAPSP